MIGKAITAILTENPDLMLLIEGRISPVRFAQGEQFPAMYYGTDNIARLNCRNCQNEFTGTLEIGIMTSTYAEMENISEAVRTILDDYDGEAGGFSLSIEPGIDGPDDEVPDLNALYKRIDFQVNATKLP